MSKFAVFSFFSGAGFLDLGFEDAGFDIVFANEISADFSYVYQYARKKLHKTELKFGLHINSIDDYLNCKDDTKFLENSIKSAKIDYDYVGFIGGPPCPDFSVAGKNKGATGVHGRLSLSYVNLICKEIPDFFVFENVKGLWKTARHRQFFDSLVEQLKTSGYELTYKLINALEYGAPQDRERIILIGIRKEILNKEEKNINDFPWAKYVKYNLENIKKIAWPEMSEFKENSIMQLPQNIIPELTVEYWFEKNNVKLHPNSDDFFTPRSGLKKMQTYSEGDVSKKCYKRLHRYRFSPTAAYGNNEVHLHPYKARRLSVAETLAIQSLPAEFELPKDLSLSAKFKTIGNGVPYLAAKGVALSLLNFLKE